MGDVHVHVCQYSQNSEYGYIIHKRKTKVQIWWCFTTPEGEKFKTRKYIKHIFFMEARYSIKASQANKCHGWKWGRKLNLSTSNRTICLKIRRDGVFDPFPCDLWANACCLLLLSHSTSIFDWVSLGRCWFYFNSPFCVYPLSSPIFIIIVSDTTIDDYVTQHNFRILPFKTKTINKSYSQLQFLLREVTKFKNSKWIYESCGIRPLEAKVERWLMGGVGVQIQHSPN